MDPKPVERTSTPGYPTRRDVLAGAASFALLSLSGRRFLFAADGSGEGKPIVAPVFEHGMGRGSIGCQMVVPPAFLSEEEGMQILSEELAKHGIKLKPGGTLEEVRVPARMEKGGKAARGDEPKESAEKFIEDMNRAASVKLDGLDPDKNIAVEFVTQEDVDSITREDQVDVEGNPVLRESVKTLDFKDTAERVAAAAAKQGRTSVFLGVFYDPVVVEQPADLLASAEAGDIEPMIQWDNQHRGNLAEIRGMLREQARDFATWLKKQNAIP